MSEYTEILETMTVAFTDDYTVVVSAGREHITFNIFKATHDEMAKMIGEAVVRLTGYEGDFE